MSYASGEGAQVARYCAMYGRVRTSDERYCGQCGAPFTPTGMPASDASAGALFGLRFVAFLIDFLIIGTVGGFFSYIGAHGDPERTARLVFLLIPVAIQVGYPWIGNSFGGTPGKRAMGLRVVRRDGSRIGLGRGLVRLLMSYISGIPLFLGYFWMLWDRDRQTWHDKASGSFVVREAR